MIRTEEALQDGPANLYLNPEGPAGRSNMKATLSIVLAVLSPALCGKQAWAQEVDPAAIAKLTSEGKIEFDRRAGITIRTEGDESYTIEPVVTDKKNRNYRTASELGALADSRGVSSQGVIPIPPPHPDHRPSPPVPIPRPEPRPRPPKYVSLAQLAAQKTIIGRLQTEGISQPDWKLPKGTYTLVLTTFEGKPVATLVNGNGEYVGTFDNIFFVEVK